MLRFLPFIIFSVLGLALVGLGHRHLADLEFMRYQQSLEQIAGGQTSAIYARLRSGEEALETLPYLFTDATGSSEAAFIRGVSTFRARHQE
ncbi:MAG TPA: hypothetical protein VLB09_02315, partial [Nitrospiria bacterium]|nr:hypothetical protein [Nitrospiria bacterium]